MQLSFLNFAMIGWFVAGLIPLLIYLFAKRKAQRILFSSLKYLSALYKEQQRQRRLRDILLLILRTLIILLLVLAFARPTLKSAFTKGNEGSFLILVDNSASMNRWRDAQSQLDRARNLAVQTIGTLQERNEAALGFFNQEAHWLTNRFETNKDLLVELTQRIDFSEYQTDFVRVLQQAAEFMEKANYANREIILITDNPKKAWEKVEQLSPNLLEDIQLKLIVVNGNHENLRLEKVQLQENLLNREQQQTVTVIAQNLGDNDRQAVFNLHLDGRVIARKSEEMAAMQRKELVFELPPLGEGWHQLTAEIEDAEAPFDNHFYLAFYVQNQIRLLECGRQPNPYLQLALRSEDQAENRFQYTFASAQSISQQMLAAADVVVLHGVDRLTDSQQFFLQQAHNQGVGILWLPTEEMDADGFNSMIQSYFPWTLENRESLVQGQFLSVSMGHKRAGFLDIFQPEMLEQIKVFSHFSLPTSVTGDLMLSNGQPFLINQEHVAFLTVPLLPKNSNFVHQGIFAPLMYRLILQLSSGMMRSCQLATVGEDIPLAFMGKTNVQTPSGLEKEILPNVNGILELMPEETGFYTLQHGQELQMLGVNLAADESILLPASSADWEPLAFSVFQGKQEALTSWLQEHRYGKEIWQQALIGALLLLLAEMLLAMHWKKKSIQSK